MIEERINDDRLSRRDFLASGLTLAGIFGGVYLLRRHWEKSDKKNLERLGSYKSIEQRVVRFGDSYWNYATQIEHSYPEMKFNEIDKRKIVNFLKNNLNNGKELYEGEIVNLPVYK